MTLLSPSPTASRRSSLYNTDDDNDDPNSPLDPTSPSSPQNLFPLMLSPPPTTTEHPRGRDDDILPAEDGIELARRSKRVCGTTHKGNDGMGVGVGVGARPVVVPDRLLPDAAAADDPRARGSSSDSGLRRSVFEAAPNLESFWTDSDDEERGRNRLTRK
jgi:hypothetical protein